ncbi:MAG: DUF3524 domain-containing protein [Spirochaetaceae bacterium]|nr:MAG: DUF3524 domain-containing protein [Spirochaetaceae bacterium]
MKVLFIETFYGGSHRSFADGVVRHSRHQVDLVTLPDRNWRQRIRTGAFEIARRVPDPREYDVVLVTDLINLGDLRALWSVGAVTPGPPVLLYIHETQITYPPPRTPRQRSEVETAEQMQDIKNCLLAERVLFNSRSHREAFLAAIDSGSGHPLPAHTGLPWVEAAQAIRERSGVVYPGVELVTRRPIHRANRPVRILWNHRRAYDKRPRRFFRALQDLAAEGVRFEVVVLGESPRGESTDGDSPAVLQAREALGDRVLHWGFAASRGEYEEWLSSSDIVVSTAIQENFGIAVVEAVAAGCVPLLPLRLSYPELIPETLHPTLLYGDERRFRDRLRETILTLPEIRKRCQEEGLSAHMHRFSWQRTMPCLDRELASCCLPGSI